MTVINMYDWVEDTLVVSESKQRLIDYHTQSSSSREPLIDNTKGESLEGYCERRNWEENRSENNRKLTTNCFDCYFIIDTIELI
jgi:hypothetical protein